MPASTELLPVRRGVFLVIGLKIPCFVAEGICPQAIEFARQPAPRIALASRIPQNSLFISLLAGNLRWRRAGDRLRPQPASPVSGSFRSNAAEKPAFGGLLVSGRKSLCSEFDDSSAQHAENLPVSSALFPFFWRIDSETLFGLHCVTGMRLNVFGWREILTS